MPDTKNHLAHETSPYLLQHANNPVEWYPWGEKALNLARETNKPILLSIGYSACHWCHVMAHESFEDEHIASIMNRHFINIKVDREERPDLDKIYQIALQILTGRPGGWPLTMFLTADNQLPFFGGTYFPKKTSHGLPSFEEILEKIANFYESYSSDIEELTQKMQQALQTLSSQNTAEGVTLNKDFLKISCNEVFKEYDPVHGGFGGQPKFPQPTNLAKLLQCHFQQPNENKFLEAAEFSLKKMAEGGLYDQLGGGFFRYCVDDQWQIPHFEKMLYDNAQLIELYAVMFRVTNNNYFKSIAEKTGEWIIHDMQSKQGGYYSTLNADTEGQEGKYYYWDKEEISALLAEEEFSIIEKYFGLNHPANFEGHYHLAVSENLNQHKILEKAKNKLLAARNQRIHPDRDEKIITAWNGLMIKGMCIAGRYLNNEKFITSAESALSFIFKNLSKNGRLFSCYKDNQAKFMGYLDDYAFLLAGIIEFLQVRWNLNYYQFAIELAEILASHFYDKKNGGFYFTANDHEALIQRPKSFVDESIPSGNGIAAKALLELGYMSGNESYIQMAEKTLQCGFRPMQEMPSAYNSLSIALAEYFHPPKIIILRGDSEELKKWQASLNEEYYPNNVILAISDKESDLPDAINKPFVENKTVAYVCEGAQCSESIDKMDNLIELIQ